jgi:hypothetical protein
MRLDSEHQYTGTFKPFASMLAYRTGYDIAYDQRLVTTRGTSGLTSASLIAFHYFTCQNYLQEI